MPDRHGKGTGERIVLLTTITDPEQAHADELAAAYHHRCEKETANDQLKTHLRAPGRSSAHACPTWSTKEIWVWLIVHYAIAVLIDAAAEAAEPASTRHDPPATIRLHTLTPRAA